MKAIISKLLALLLVSSASFAALYQDPNAAVEDRVQDLLARMTLEEKLGQMIQLEAAQVAPIDLTVHLYGGLLNSAPTPNTPPTWADYIDAYQAAALSTRLKIPVVYGSDGVHGHNYAYGATIFPHNIGLGATRDPSLAREVARITAKEMAATGVHWTFAPVVARGPG